MGQSSSRPAPRSGRHVAEELLTGTIGGIQNRRLTWLGHNNVDGRYELTTVDDLDTHMQRYEGPTDGRVNPVLGGLGDAADEATAAGPVVVTLHGTYTQAVSAAGAAGDGISRATAGDPPQARPMLAGVRYAVRSELTIDGPDQHTHRFYFRPLAGGTEGLAFQFVYTRQGGAAA